MSKNRITGRELRHGSPEENLSPGESVLVEKRGGKVFELKRVDAGEKDILTGLEQLLIELPLPGMDWKGDLSGIILEDRQ